MKKTALFVAVSALLLTGCQALILESSGGLIAIDQCTDKNAEICDDIKGVIGSDS